ncbi:MAG TPA: Clp protease N-terminal domain-containing protein [Gemmatimonadaceae bacterium]|nr:Clp protease N-terminal domain-containing protein [Gemmatimonadaceae bacterium]
MHGYNFTTDVRAVLAVARDEAAALNHEYVGTEHILLALLRRPETGAVAVLQTLGLDLEGVRDEVLAVVRPGTGSRRPSDVPYTSRAKKTIELAMTQARALGTNYVDTEHLLLGLIAEEKGIAAQVLAAHGITLEAASAEARRGLGGSPPAADSAPPGAFVPRRAGSPPATERLRVIIHSAYEFAKSRGCRTVTPAHFGIALLDHDDGLANAVFTRLGLDAPRARATLEHLPAPEPESIGPDDALQLDQALFAGMERARIVAHAPYLSTAHLALALLDESCSAAPVFIACGVTQASFSEELARISG